MLHGTTLGLNAARCERRCVLPANSAELHLLAMPYRPGWLQSGRCALSPTSARRSLTSVCGATQYDEEAGHEAFADDFHQAMTYFTKLSLTGGEVRFLYPLAGVPAATGASALGIVQGPGART